MTPSIETPQASRSLRWGANMGILWGAIGAVLGVLGAATFLPYRSADNLSFGLAAILSVISGVGAAVSGLGAWEGWRLRHLQAWSWPATGLSAVGSIVVVAVMALVWAPSVYFLGVVLFFYILELLFLLAGLSSYRALRARGSPE